MTENSEPIVRLGTPDTEGNVNGQFEVDYATDTGDALLRHISSGAEVRWNQTESRWELNQPTAVEEFLVDRLNSLEQNFIQLQSSLGDETQPVPGTSHFNAVQTEQLSREGTLIQQGSSWDSTSTYPKSDPSDTSSTSYTTIATLGVGFGGEQIPAGASLHLNLMARPDTVPTGETGSYSVSIRQRDPTAEDVTGNLPELEIEVTDADNGSRVGSGWTEITSVTPSNREIFIIDALRGKVTGGTMASDTLQNFAIAWDWRVD